MSQTMRLQGFYRHRTDLEQIVKMMDEDVRMTRIAYDFTTTDKEELNDLRVFPEQRWNQYREVFRRAKVAIYRGRFRRYRVSVAQTVGPARTISRCRHGIAFDSPGHFFTAIRRFITS